MKPRRLTKGDTIGIMAPASLADTKRLKQSIPFFEQMGLYVKLGKSTHLQHGYLAGTDAERLDDFHQMMADHSIKAIMFARGGYGTPRIASQIDYHLVERNPKILWGYSDITYLHTAILQQTGLTVFHGPMPASDIADSDFDELSASMFKQLFNPVKLHYSEAISPLKVIVPGEASGELVGGNLSLLVSSLGTPYEIDTYGKLLLLEDIGEEPYRVDSMLNQLKLAGKLDAAAGVVLGDFAEADPPEGKPSLSLNHVFYDYVAILSCPVMSGFKIGHCIPHFSLPLGEKAMLSTADKSLTVEAGVQ
ncbi:muramoyltetrapeptide carboxypeptidase [Lentibacillus halodurans]|uniref:Muramoyltetrapeptide carboxypeptidase n=1 Tax=Lentibacillus halodurans TaxID=237679 RepID=A0A1I0ZMH7_9BACI|nr:LD-carboxypeptidase [Lentibacillus halodurans]SFB26701.1 muramoyltetrapeptide carboxypeptidase [Lentibacillus halodurans]